MRSAGKLSINLGMLALLPLLLLLYMRLVLFCYKNLPVQQIHQKVVGGFAFELWRRCHAGSSVLSSCEVLDRENDRFES